MSALRVMPKSSEQKERWMDFFQKHGFQIESKDGFTFDVTDWNPDRLGLDVRVEYSRLLGKYPCSMQIVRW